MVRGPRGAPCPRSVPLPAHSGEMFTSVVAEGEACHGGGVGRRPLVLANPFPVRTYYLNLATDGRLSEGGIRHVAPPPLHSAR